LMLTVISTPIDSRTNGVIPFLVEA